MLYLVLLLYDDRIYLKNFRNLLSKPEVDECLKRLKSNYNMLNGFFLEKNLSWKDLPQDFEFLINPENMCFSQKTTVKKPKDIFIITMIHTALNHFDLRESIRETYGSVKEYFNYNIRLVFILGTTKDQSIIARITNESKIYGDIVQASFVDAYRNLTYKITTGFKWISYYCPHAKFVLKLDDDFYVDIFQVITTLDYLDKTYGPYLIHNIDKIRRKERLLPYTYNQTTIVPVETFEYVINDLKLREAFTNRTSNSFTDKKMTSLNATHDKVCDRKSYTIFDTDSNIFREYKELFGDEKRLRDIILCSIRFNSIVMRNPGYKWTTTTKDYLGTYYEPFCLGAVMILTPPSAYKLYKAYFTQPYFFIDDVHVTGKLATMTGALMINIEDTINHDVGALEAWLKEKSPSSMKDSSSKFKYMINANGANRTNMKAYWNRTLIAHNRFERFFV
ncbi:unnamed protein product [Gordionus sp. m RMFG-2023]